MADRVSVAFYPAYGGPEFAGMGDDGFPTGPTDEGEYRVATCGRHSSKRYPLWSKIPWGSKLKVHGREVMVHFEGKWQQLSNVVTLTKKDVENYYEQLYFVRKVPDTWVFNDFGHMTCYLYRDANHNGRRDKQDKRERIHGEFFHTTPINEAETVTPPKVVTLEESHGCIHLRPTDIDEMIERGFMKTNTRVVVHSYADRKVIFPRRGYAVAPFELHFFPSMKQVLVTGDER